MPLIRGHHSFDDKFTQIPNDWLRDTRLSLKAIGLLAQIMSHAVGWNMSIRSLAKANGTGVDTIKSAVLELESNGYLVRSEKQKQNDDGTFADYDWVTTDPFQNPVTVKPRHGETVHKEYYVSLEEHLEENIERVKSDNDLDDKFKEFWKEYPKRTDKRAALKAFKSALTRTSFEDILAGAIRYANDPNLPEIRYVKNPATWLNADAWENPPLPPRKRNKESEREADKRRLDEWVKQFEEGN